MDCFITRNEFRQFLLTALDSGCEIQVNKNLTSPIPAVCAGAEEVISAVNDGARSFLLEHPKISRHPISLSHFIKDGVTMWYPRSKVGGPAIEVMYWAPFEKEGEKIIPCSLISYHSKIFNPKSGELEPAGEAVKIFSRSLLAPLREISKTVRSKNRSAIMTPDVENMLASGWILAAPFAKNGK